MPSYQPKGGVWSERLNDVNHYHLNTLKSIHCQIGVSCLEALSRLSRLLPAVCSSHRLCGQGGVQAQGSGGHSKFSSLQCQGEISTSSLHPHPSASVNSAHIAPRLLRPCSSLMSPDFNESDRCKQYGGDLSHPVVHCS